MVQLAAFGPQTSSIMHPARTNSTRQIASASKSSIPSFNKITSINCSVNARRSSIAAHAAPEWPAIALRRARQVIARDAPFLGGNAPSAEELTVVDSTDQQHQQPTVPDFFSPEALISAIGVPAVPLAAATVDFTTAAPTAAPAAAAAVAPDTVVDPDAANPNYNKSGLNGLTVGATNGLATVSALACELPWFSCCK